MLYVRAAGAAVALVLLVGSEYMLATHRFAAGHHGFMVVAFVLGVVLFLAMAVPTGSGGGS